MNVTSAFARNEYDQIAMDGQRETQRKLLEARGVVQHQAEFIARLTELLTWKQIDTAPKDGTRILVYSCVHTWKSIGIAYWGRSSPLDRQAWLGGHCHIDHIDQPTHWMPLPLGPEGE